ENCVEYWAQNFMDKMHQRRIEHDKETKRAMEGDVREKLVADYAAADQRLILLDYDGTLVPFSDDPAKAFPDELLLELLKDLSAKKNTRVVLISGRRCDVLEDWLRDIPIDLLAEHGFWVRKEGEWQSAEKPSLEWMKDVRTVFEAFVHKTAGTFIEEKDSGLAWHYRNCDGSIAEIRAYQLMKSLVNYCTRNGLEIIDGHKVIEVKNRGVNKGTAAMPWLQEQADFAMVIGDDQTDEDIFQALPRGAWGIKVGNLHTSAPYRLSDYNQVRELLHQIILSDDANQRQSQLKHATKTG
ncbi:MAG TPA: trehalose-phosphatase, partial [Cryomorphaceae bacterium]|nr:trehalose-phosphatase [Cryomorphaceae bacterium]